MKLQIVVLSLPCCGLVFAVQCFCYSFILFNSKNVLQQNFPNKPKIYRNLFHTSNGANWDEWYRKAYMVILLSYSHIRIMFGIFFLYK